MKSKLSNLRPATIVRWMAACLTIVCIDTLAQQTEGLEALQAAAQRGEVRALYTLAVEYERGEKVARDFAKSNELYCKAAARGDSEALLKMGVIYSIGRSVLADEGVAALLIAKAVEKGNVRAQELLQHVGGRFGSALPACLSEPIESIEAVIAAPDAPQLVPSGRKDIELLVLRWAPEYSVDPDLVIALIAVESKFDAAAVSPKNAQGLMQLIPATAARFGVKDVFNPLDNLKGGLAYLRWLMAYFKGEVALVLAAYNAGEEAVEKHRGIPPYTETINYVRQITRVYKKTNHPYLAEIVAPSSALTRIKNAD